MGGRAFSSRSAPSPSQSYSAPRTAAGSGFTYSAPYYGPSPFGGVYMGPAVGIGSSFSIIMIAFVAFVLVSGFLSDGSQGSVLTATDRTTVLKLQVYSILVLKHLIFCCVSLDLFDLFIQFGDCSAVARRIGLI